MSNSNFSALVKSFQYRPSNGTSARNCKNDTIKSRSFKNDKLSVPTNMPATSKLASPMSKNGKQLKPLPNLLCTGLHCVFVGFNPGIMSSESGHYYAHPSNHFWSLLSKSGITNRPVTSFDDCVLQKECKLGFTDLVSRPTAGIKDLSKAELNRSVPDLETKLQAVSPQIICIVGKGIWESIHSVKYGRLPGTFTFGLQDETFANAQVFVMPSTSGLVSSYNREQRLQYFVELSKLIDDFK